MPPATRDGPRRDGSRNAWPILAAIAAFVMICLALLWALLLAGSGLGGGSGGGTGVGLSNGSGTGDEGEGGSSGVIGEGTGAGAEGPGSPAPVGNESQHAARPMDARPAATEAASRPSEELAVGLSDIHRPTAPAPSPSGSPEPSGGSGRSGGGSGGSAGKDPGARGEASFTLVWSYSRGRQGGDNAGGPDVDVWVEDPLGRVVNTSQEGRWRMGPTPEGGQADRDDQGGWGTGEGGGPERIFWPKGKAPRGKYRYGVRWFKGLGSARYTLRVYRDEDLFETKTGAITESDHGRNIELGTIVVE